MIPALTTPWSVLPTAYLKSSVTNRGTNKNKETHEPHAGNKEARAQYPLGLDQDAGIKV